MKSDERETSNKLFEELHKEFNFEIDLAASDKLHKLPLYYTKYNSAFNYPWDKRSFLNPPYSNLYKWVEYADKQFGLIVMILPCDTSTAWFHDFIWNDKIHRTRSGWQIRLPRGRFTFGSYTNTPKFATIIAVHNYQFSYSAY